MGERGAPFIGLPKLSACPASGLGVNCSCTKASGVRRFLFGVFDTDTGEVPGVEIPRRRNRCTGEPSLLDEPELDDGEFIF